MSTDSKLVLDNSPWSEFRHAYAQFVQETGMTEEAFYGVHFWSKNKRPLPVAAEAPQKSCQIEVATTTSDVHGVKAAVQAKVGARVETTGQMKAVSNTQCSPLTSVSSQSDVNMDLDGNSGTYSTGCVRGDMEKERDVESVNVEMSTRSSNVLQNIASPLQVLAPRQSQPSTPTQSQLAKPSMLPSTKGSVAANSTTPSEVTAWCQMANFLFQLVRKSPECPTAILRNIYRKMELTFDQDSTSLFKKENWLLDAQEMVKQGEDAELCRMVHALLPVLSRQSDVACLATIALILRQAGMKRPRNRSGQFKSKVCNTDLYALYLSSPFKHIRSCANRALYMACTMRPDSFFGVLLLNYMDADRQGMERFDTNMLRIFLSIFTKDVKSITQILPDVLQKSKVWSETIVPCLDFIVFELIDLLESLHQSVMRTSFAQMPKVIQKLFPVDANGEYSSTRLCVSAVHKLRHNVYVDFPSKTLLHDHYYSTPDMNTAFVNGVRRYMSGVQVENQWFMRQRNRRRDSSHCTNFQAFAKLLATAARQSDAVGEGGSRKNTRTILSERLPQGSPDSAVQFGRTRLTMPFRGWIPMLLDDWCSISPRYSPFLRSVEFVGEAASNRDCLERQAALLLLANVVDDDATKLLDEDPKLRLSIKVKSKKAYTIDTFNTMKRYD